MLAARIALTRSAQSTSQNTRNREPTVKIAGIWLVTVQQDGYHAKEGNLREQHRQYATDCTKMKIALTVNVKSALRTRTMY
jgi:hypothetical protein